MFAYEKQGEGGETEKEEDSDIHQAAAVHLAAEESEKDLRLDQHRSPLPGASSSVVTVAVVGVGDDAAPVLVASRRPGSADLARALSVTRCKKARPRSRDRSSNSRS